MKRNLILLTLSVVAALSAACKSEAKREREESSRSEVKRVVTPQGLIRLSPEQVKANGIQTASARQQEIALTITAIGRVKARAGDESEVFSPFPGRLIADPARLPHVGSFVRKGQLLAEIEQQLPVTDKVQFTAQAAQLQSEITQAQQEVNFRRIELDRSKELFEGGAIPLKQLQNAELTLKQGEAKLTGVKRAKEQYDAALAEAGAPRRAPIRSPISGIVVAAALTAGQQTDTSKSLLRIVDLNTVWVEVPIHESDLLAVRLAQRAEITTPANPKRTYRGNLVTIGAAVDSANRTVPVIFSAVNPDGSLKLDMTAGARIPKGPSARVLLVPGPAVLYEEGQAFVYVETRPGTYSRRTITAGDRSGDNVIVTSGLSAGEKVVSVGAGALRSEMLKGQIPKEEEERR